LNFSFTLRTEEAGSLETLAATRIPNYTLLFLTATLFGILHFPAPFPFDSEQQLRLIYGH